VVLEGDSSYNLDAADPEPPTLEDETEVPQRGCTSTTVQVPPDTVDESRPEANDHKSGDADEGRAARRKRLAAREKVDIKDVVVRELQQKRTREEHRYHSKKGVGRAGRVQGKAKQDTNVKKTDWEI